MTLPSIKNWIVSVGFAMGMIAIVFPGLGGDRIWAQESPRKEVLSSNTLARNAIPPLPAPSVDLGSSDGLSELEADRVSTPRSLRFDRWSFGRSDDSNFDRWPDGWLRYTGVGYPKFVRAELVSRDSDFERRIQKLDALAIGAWQAIRKKSASDSWIASLPTPPSLADATVDRYLKIDLDGGQFKVQSPTIASTRMYQYQLRCDVTTKGLRYDSVRVEFVFLDESGEEIMVRSSESVGGTTDWTTVVLDMVRPPKGATAMAVRLMVVRSEDGFEDIRGSIGFDNVRIDQFPQLRVKTDRLHGIYTVGYPVDAKASILGLTLGDSSVRFRVFNQYGQQVDGAEVPIDLTKQINDTDNEEQKASRVHWRGRLLEPGFYRLIASIDGTERSGLDWEGSLTSVQPNQISMRSPLASETTFAVVDPSLQGDVHGPFGWTLPREAVNIPPRQLAEWLTSVGVAWVKYPCWVSAEDADEAERIANMFSKLQDYGIQTVGMLDVPPDHDVAKYQLRARRDLVASELFRDVQVWRPELEPVMSRLSLKVKTWQLGGERDFSFLGRPRLRDSIEQIAKGLQGFGQPMDMVISWPWLEAELPSGETSWQAVCRSADPPMGFEELDAFLTLEKKGHRNDGPSTWLLMDPVGKSKYDQQNRVRDLVLRMAAVRSHRVEAAWLSDPYHPDHGVLRPDGRPEELLLPWRTTNRVIGNLRKVGSLRLRGRSNNAVFVGDDKAVLMLWAPKPTQEKIFLGENVRLVDVWGRVKELPTQPDPHQPHQVIDVGPVPVFVTGVDPLLLAFRMSVETEPTQFDSFLGEKQKLKVLFANPTRDAMAGTVRVVSPKSWVIEDPVRLWEVLAGRSAEEDYEVVLGNTAKIGSYELPIQFELDTVPPQLITVHREINVGPEGLQIKVTTRLMKNGDMRVQIEMTNRSPRLQAYNTLLFAPGRQYESSFIQIRSGETVRREIYWDDGQALVGRGMTLRAIEQDGNRVLNYPIVVKR